MSADRASPFPDLPASGRSYRGPRRRGTVAIDRQRLLGILDRFIAVTSFDADKTKDIECGNVARRDGHHFEEQLLSLTPLLALRQVTRIFEFVVQRQAILRIHSLPPPAPPARRESTHALQRP